MTTYEAIGKAAGCRKLSHAFYTRVERDPVLRPLFPGKSFRCAIEEFSAFLVQFLGGPSEHTQYRWWVSLRESHLRFRIGASERNAWLKNMAAALDDVKINEPAREALVDFFTSSSNYLVNQEERERTECSSREMAWRWRAQRTLDQVAAVIRSGNSLSCSSLDLI